MLLDAAFEVLSISSFLRVLLPLCSGLAFSRAPPTFELSKMSPSSTSRFLNPIGSTMPEPTPSQLHIMEELDLISSTTVEGVLYGIIFTLFCLYTTAFFANL